MDKLRVSIVGAGLMGYWHAHAAHCLGAHLVGTADIDPQLATRLARRYPGAQAFTDMESMLSATSPDLVHICTAPESHGILASQAIRNGAHVLVEKPLALSLDKTRSLLDEAAVTKVSVCPVHQFVFQHGVEKAHSLLPSLGKIMSIRSTIFSAGATDKTNDGLKKVVADILPHPLSLLHCFVPKARPETFNWQTVNTQPGELSVTTAVDDIVFSILISMRSRPTRCEFDVYCSGGSLHLNLFQGYVVVQKGASSRRHKITHPFSSAINTSLAATVNLMRRSLQREWAYPGLKELINRFYGAVSKENGMPITANQILFVAAAHDELIKIAMPSLYS